MKLSKLFGRIYYRRNAAKTITSLVMTIDPTVTKAGATFDTDGAADQLFVGMTAVIEGFTYRVASITSDTEFELSAAHDAAETVSGVFSTPKLSTTLGANPLVSAVISEVETYWTQFFDVRAGAGFTLAPGDQEELTTGDKPYISENGEFNAEVLRTEEYSSSPDIEGRWDTLRTALQDNHIDILIWTNSYFKPYAMLLRDIVGAMGMKIESNKIRQLNIALSQEAGIYDTNNVENISSYTIETPVFTPGAGGGGTDVTITCSNCPEARIYYTVGAAPADPDESDTWIADGGIVNVPDTEILKARAYATFMTTSAIKNVTY